MNKIAFAERCRDYEHFFGLTINDKNSYTWHLRCDPDQHVENKTFVRFTRIIEGYIKREDEINKEHNCDQNCDVKNTKDYNCTTNTRRLRTFKDCDGEILMCDKHKLFNQIEYCDSTNLGLQRYQYVNLDNTVKLNDKAECNGNAIKMTKTFQKTGILKWSTSDCHYCICYYHNPNIEYPQKYISLIEEIASENKVVTGLRFVKHESVVYIQIQEGEIQYGINVNSSTVVWKDNELLDPYRTYTPKESYFSLSPINNERISIDLDSIVAENGFVVTGNFNLLSLHDIIYINLYSRSAIRNSIEK